LLNGPYQGQGIQQSPASGQLDSDSWAVFGAQHGDVDFGETGVAYPSSHARGTNTGGVAFGGLWAFDVSGVGDYAFGFQPSTSSFAGSGKSGTFKLRIQNNTGESIEAIRLAYEIHVYNDQANSTRLDFAYSINSDIDGNYIVLDNFTTPGTTTGASWTQTDKEFLVDLSSNPLNAGEVLYLRWFTEDAAGSNPLGNRDELALDDISITFDPAVDETS